MLMDDDREQWREFYVQRDKRLFYMGFRWLLDHYEFYAMMGY